MKKISLLYLFLVFVLFSGCFGTGKITKGLIFTDKKKKDKGPEKTFEFLNSSTREILLANRHYIYAKLTSIFGTNLDALLVKDILQNVEVFGGLCDGMMNVNRDCGGFERDHYRQHFSHSTVVREAIKIKTCEKLVADNTSFNYALSRAGINDASIPLNKENIQKLYKIFFLLDQISDNSINLLLKLNGALNGLEAHKTALVFICSLIAWEVI